MNVQNTKEINFLPKYISSQHKGFNLNSYVGIPFFKIFFNKVFNLKNFVFTAIIIALIFLVAVSMMPSKYYFVPVAVTVFFSVVTFLYSQIFFTFRNTHYYTYLKNETKFFDLKIYFNMLLAIFVFCFFIALSLFFLTGFFSLMHWGLNFDIYTDDIFTTNYNWSTWAWTMIFYQIFVIIILSFAICLFCQQLFNNKKSFNVSIIFIIVYISINIIISSFGMYIWEIESYALHDPNLSSSDVVYITLTDPGIYFNPSDNTLYYYPIILTDILFFQVFSVFTNPFYSCGMFIGLGTSSSVFNEEYWLSLGGTLDNLMINIEGEYMVAYEDINCAIDFSTHSVNYGLNYSSASYIFFFWLPYIWIAILVSGSFFLKIIK